jgi:DNA-binding transcriptional MerR regulator
MEHEEMGLLRIGLFSRLTQVSVRMLRHYHEQGLLVPELVDERSGYRYYRTEQLEMMRLIGGLREAGFSIGETMQVLTARRDPERLRELIDTQRNRLDGERVELTKRQSALSAISIALKENPMEFNVQTITMPAMTVGALRERVPSYADEAQLWQRVMPLLMDSQATFPAGGIAGATYYDAEYQESNADVEVWIQTAAPFSPKEPLLLLDIPEREVVTVTLKGDYSLMPQATAAIGEYIATHQLNTGPMFNIYRVGPAQDPDPSKWVTDVCFPVIAHNPPHS